MNLENTQIWMKKLTIKLAREIAGKDEVQVQFNKRWKRLNGRCITSVDNPNFIPNITYSIPFIEANLNLPIALRFLIIHEVCHIVYPNHGKDFKKLCKQNGLDSKKGKIYDATLTNEIKRNWFAKCSTCHHKFQRFNKPKRKRSCPYCSSSFNPIYELIFYSTEEFKC